MNKYYKKICTSIKLRPHKQMVWSVSPTCLAWCQIRLLSPLVCFGNCLEAHKGTCIKHTRVKKNQTKEKWAILIIIRTKGRSVTSILCHQMRRPPAKATKSILKLQWKGYNSAYLLIVPSGAFCVISAQIMAFQHI